MPVIDKDVLFQQVVDDLSKEGITVSIDLVKSLLDLRDEVLSVYSKDFETIKYGTVGKFTIFEGRKHALENKKALIAEGYSPEEAGKILRERLRKTYETMTNKTRKSKRKDKPEDSKQDIVDLPLM